MVGVEIVGFRICSKCGRSKPSTHEYFHKDAQRSDGLRSWCKECSCASAAAWRARIGWEILSKRWRPHLVGHCSREGCSRFGRITLGLCRFHWLESHPYLVVRQMDKRNARNADVRLRLLEMCGMRCVDCGFDEHPVVLGFDHIAGKNGTVSRMIYDGVSWERLVEEVKKCVVRCANCHRIKTAAAREAGPKTKKWRNL